MKQFQQTLRKLRFILLAAVACFSYDTMAYPPAPFHILHGTVRNEMGEPLAQTLAEVILEDENGVVILTTQIQPDTLPGENYRLVVPMDSLTAPDLYKPNARVRTLPFRLKVKIGTTVFLPIEMAGDFSTLGEPAGDTLINLTLSIDSDEDGLPDAWENLVIQMLGGGLGLGDIDPDGDSDGDGISNGDEYIAGTYAFDPLDALKIIHVRKNGPGVMLQFFGVAGRTYSVQSSLNLEDWFDEDIRIPAANVLLPVAAHRALSSKIIEAEVMVSDPEPEMMFFRVRVR